MPSVASRPPASQKDPSNWWHYSANQWWGCEKISPACAHCYAEAFDKYAGRNLDPEGRFHWGRGVPRLFIGGSAKMMRRMNAIFAANPHLGRPRVFANSMSDWLDPAVPVEWLWSLIETIKDCKAMDFLLLTKRPGFFAERLLTMAEAIPASRRSVDWWIGGGQPENVWAGATVESAEYAHRIQSILCIGARIHWLSCEPLMGHVSLPLSTFNHQLSTSAIDWIVIGGESGGNARPSNPVHIQSLALQCQLHGIPFWFKQWGEWVGGRYDSRKSKVMLQDGSVRWIKSKAQLGAVKFWDEKDGVFDLVSARVGMTRKPIPSLSDQPVRTHTDNHLLNGCIIRQVPA